MQTNANLVCNTQYKSTLITWFLDIGAYQHVTPNNTNVASSKPYTGTNQLHVGDGKGLTISHIAHSKIHAPKHYSLYPIFYTYLILKILCYLFKSFA
jgi:hypothetical protein